MRPDRAFLLAHPAHFIALGFGSGLAPRAPGTFGTLAAFPLFALLHPFGSLTVLVAAAVAFVIGVWAAQRAGAALGVGDHGSIVIDEIAAFLVVLAVSPPGWLWWGIAFLAFRVFDIAKPWPISVADRRIKGGFGVMIDDLLAAGYAIAVLFILRNAIA